jgi:hypothetical protein
MTYRLKQWATWHSRAPTKEPHIPLCDSPLIVKVLAARGGKVSYLLQELHGGAACRSCHNLEQTIDRSTGQELKGEMLYDGINIPGVRHGPLEIMCLRTRCYKVC